MNHQELRDIICSRKPRYNTAFKPLMERISTKGDTSGKGDFSTFGAFYQTFMYAYIIGLRLNKKTPLDCSDKSEFAPIGNWKPSPIRDFIIMMLLNESEEFGARWSDLDDADEDAIRVLVIEMVKRLEAYANVGFAYLKEKWDNERYEFNDPFVFVNFLQDLTD